jgi:hypothetical protein
VIAVTESEWLACKQPDELLQFLVGRVSRAQLAEFVRRCWVRVAPLVKAPPHEFTVVEQFAGQAGRMSDMDAATYAYEAALKAAGWAPVIHVEQAHQAELLRRIVGSPFRDRTRA